MAETFAASAHSAGRSLGASCGVVQLGAHTGTYALRAPGLVAGIVAPVHIEVGDACEALATQLTAVGFLTCVCAPVLCESGGR